VDAGTRRTLSSENVRPAETQISTVPMPTAKIHDPPMPEIGWGGIERLEIGALGYDMGVGPGVEEERRFYQTFDADADAEAIGSAENWLRSTDLLCSHQSTGAWGPPHMAMYEDKT